MRKLGRMNNPGPTEMENTTSTPANPKKRKRPSIYDVCTPIVMKKRRTTPPVAPTLVIDVTQPNMTLETISEADLEESTLVATPRRSAPDKSAGILWPSPMPNGNHLEDGEVTEDNSVVVLHQVKPPVSNDDTSLQIVGEVEGNEVKIVAETVKSIVKDRSRRLQKSFQKKTHLKMITKSRMRSIQLRDRSFSQLRDKSFNQSLIDYMRQRKQVKEDRFNKFKGGRPSIRPRFPTLHSPQKPKRKVQTPLVSIFNPNAGPMINFVSPGKTVKFHARKRLRPILIDGQNVAVAHGKEIARGFDSKLRFSARGIQIVVKYFVDRGHNKSEVVVWLPEILEDKVDKKLLDFRDNKAILDKLEADGHIKYSPVRRVGGEIRVSYDDRLIVESATANGGVIVSNDKFRDLVHEERGKFRAAIENRRVSFSFLNNNFFPTRDNLGKKGPGLDELLEF